MRDTSTAKISQNAYASVGHDRSSRYRARTRLLVIRQEAACEDGEELQIRLAVVGFGEGGHRR